MIIFEKNPQNGRISAVQHPQSTIVDLDRGVVVLDDQGEVDIINYVSFKSGENVGHAPMIHGINDLQMADPPTEIVVMNHKNPPAVMLWDVEKIKAWLRAAKWAGIICVLVFIVSMIPGFLKAAVVVLTDIASYGTKALLLLLEIIAYVFAAVAILIVACVLLYSFFTGISWGGSSDVPDDRGNANASFGSDGQINITINSNNNSNNG